MIDATARAVAFIAARLVNGPQFVDIVDQVSGARSGFSGEVGPEEVVVRDQQLRILISGRSTGDGTLWLIHHDATGHLTLAADGPGCLAGYDDVTGHAFDVFVSAGGAVELLDYESGCWRRYQIEGSAVLTG